MASVDVLDDLMDLPDDAAGMNPALAEWAATTEPGESVAWPEGPTGRSSSRAPRRAGLCRVCGRAADERCLRCESAVCTRHHHAMYGLCDPCRDHQDDAASEDVDSVERQSGDSGADGRPFADEYGAPHDDLDIPWVE